MVCLFFAGDGLRAPQPQSSSNSEAGILIDLYEASQHNGPVLHYYVVVVDSTIAEHTDPNDFDIEQVDRLSVISVNLLSSSV